MNSEQFLFILVASYFACTVKRVDFFWATLTFETTWEESVSTQGTLLGITAACFRCPFVTAGSGGNA